MNTNGLRELLSDNGLIQGLCVVGLASLAAYLFRSWRDWRDSRIIFDMLSASATESDWNYRTSHAISSNTKIPVSRVAELCNRHQKIRRNEKERESWTIVESSFSTMTRKISGWHRLWILAATAFLFIVTSDAVSVAMNQKAVGGAKTLPYVNTKTLELLAPSFAEFDRRKPQLTDSSSYFKIIELREELFGIYEVEEDGFESIALEVPKTLSDEQITAIVRDYSLAARDELMWKRLRTVFSAIGDWAVVSLAVLGIGHGVAWVVRGFRQNATTN